MTDNEQRPSWSRPPFQPGHEQSITHGATSERRLGPLAAEIESAARSSPQWPDYLNRQEFAAAVRSWARAEAVAELLWTWLAALDGDVPSMLAEVAEEDSREDRHRGGSRRLTRSRRVSSVLVQLDRAQARAATLRRAIGLDPSGQAKIVKDLSAARFLDGHAPGVALVEALDAKAAARAALEQAEHDGNGPE